MIARRAEVVAESSALRPAVAVMRGRRSLGARLAACLPESRGRARLWVIVLLLTVWELAARLFGDPLFIAPLTRACLAAIELLQNRAVVDAILLATFEILSGFVLAVAIGLFVGLAVGLNSFLLKTFHPIIMMLYAIPQAPFLPLFVLVFGIGATSKIVYGFTHGIFVVIVTVVAGVQNIDHSLLKAARSMGASNRQILTSIIAPTMLPSFFTGMRLGLIGVILGVLLAELYVTSGGVGFFTSQFTHTFQPDKLFAMIAILAIIAVTLNELARRAEIRASRWRG